MAISAPPAAPRPVISNQQPAVVQPRLAGLPVTYVDGLPAWTVQVGHDRIEAGRETWLKCLRVNVEAVGLVVHEVAEVQRTMQVRMVDVSKWAPSKVAKPKPVLQQPTGIKLLCADLQKLVGDLAVVSPDDTDGVAAIVGRYGKARDAMKELRAAFAEAEGAFETAQALLSSKLMGDED